MNAVAIGSSGMRATCNQRGRFSPEGWRQIRPRQWRRDINVGKLSEFGPDIRLVVSRSGYSLLRASVAR